MITCRSRISKTIANRHNAVTYMMIMRVLNSIRSYIRMSTIFASMRMLVISMRIKSNIIRAVIVQLPLLVGVVHS